jgi:hypothetical protein
MVPRLLQAVAAVLALAATIVGFYATLVLWSLAVIRCPKQPAAWTYVPPVLVVTAGLLGSVFLIRRRSRPVHRAAAWGMLVGWILWAALAISMRRLPFACGVHES